MLSLPVLNFCFCAHLAGCELEKDGIAFQQVELFNQLQCEHSSGLLQAANVESPSEMQGRLVLSLLLTGMLNNHLNLDNRSRLLRKFIIFSNVKYKLIVSLHIFVGGMSSLPAVLLRWQESASEGGCRAGRRNSRKDHLRTGSHAQSGQDYWCSLRSAGRT